MSKDNKIGGFEVFEDLATTLTSNVRPGAVKVDEEEENIPELDPKDINLDNDEEDDSDNTIIDNNDNDSSTDEGDSSEEENYEEVDEGDDEEEGSGDTSEEDEKAELGEYEGEITEYVVEQLSNTLGWDLKEDGEFKNIEDVVKYLGNVVEQNSSPRYPNEEVQQLADFVANGGDLRKFYDNVYSGVDVDNVNLSNADTQKQVIKEQLKDNGYSDDAIKRRLERYEDTGILEEEAEEALDLLKKSKAKKQEKLLKEQEKFQQERQKTQQQFVSDVSSSIKEMKDIRGIKLNDRDKQDLLKYMFQPESDGRTRYEKDYRKNPMNMVESAFFTMKGDAIFKQIEKHASSEAAKKIKSKLASSKKKVKGGTGSTGSVDSSINSFLRASKFLKG